MKKRIAAFGLMASLLGAFLIAALPGSPSSAAGQVTTLYASLSGEGETQGGDTDGSGNAKITLNASTQRVCFNLNWQRIRAPFAAHIHEGAAGEDGDIVVPLFEGQLPKNILGVRGCTKDVSAQDINRIVRNPEDFYVNVHNKPFPAGALRGQLQEAGQAG